MEFNIWELLAGIGILLFGMHVFEQSLKYLGGNKFKPMLKKYTKNPFAAIFAGAGTTVLMQSSSLVMLLVLAFTGAGVMQLYSAIGITIGAGIGTTISTLLVAFIGFGEFKISSFALPMIAVGGLGLIFVKKESHIYRAKLLVGFGLLFLGLDYMKTSVDAIQENFDLSSYQDLSLFAFGILGVVVTLIVQSSSATGVMNLAALGAGIISFPASIAIVIGANIGTTVTGIIASLGGAIEKRQVALSQILFKLLSLAIWIPGFYLYIDFVLYTLGLESNLLVANAITNLLLNLTTGIMFGFFLTKYTNFIKYLLPAKSDETLTLHIDKVGEIKDESNFVEAALYALENDTQTLVEKTLDYNIYVFGLTHSQINEQADIDKLTPKDVLPRDKNKHKIQYDKAKIIANKMLDILLPLKNKLHTQRNVEKATRIEKTINASLRSLKSIKNIYHDMQDLKATTDPFLQKLYANLFDDVIEVYHYIASITDRDYNTENFKQLTKAVDSLKAFHESFISNLKDITAEKDEELQLSELINIDHYINQGSTMLVKAVQYSYLTAQEEKTFDDLTT